MIEHWIQIATKTLAETRVFTLVAHMRRSRITGREAEFYVLECGDWVNVVAVTESREMVFVEQYRHGVERTTFEIPGGMVDPEDESPEGAARRELLEETGFAAETWIQIGTVDPNPAIQSNRCHTFLAAGARQVSAPAPDENEEIAVKLVPVADVPELVSAGRIDHALVVAALYWWELHERTPTTSRI